MDFKNDICKAAKLGIGFTAITSMLAGCIPAIPGLDSGSDSSSNSSGDSCTYVRSGKTSCSDTFSYPSGASDSCADSSSAVLYSSRTYAPNLCPSSGVVGKCGSTASLPNTYYYSGYSSAELAGLQSVCTSFSGTWSTPTTTTTGATVGVTGTWNYSYNTNYTNAKCTFLNGPGTGTWIWTEDSAGKITSATSSTTVTTNRTRSGNTITSTGYWNSLGLTRTDYWTWNGSNTISGSMTAICYSSTTLIIAEEISVPFTATRQ